jgi:hypothetical protein
MAALLQAGWEATTPGIWHSRDRMEFGVLGNRAQDKDIVSAFRTQLYDTFWAEASRKQHGQGLETGAPYIGAMHDVVCMFRRVKRQDLASIAEQIAIGGSTTGDKMDINKSCAICGSTDSAEHRGYQCEGVLGMLQGKWEQDWWQKTKWLCDMGAVRAYLN